MKKVSKLKPIFSLVLVLLVSLVSVFSVQVSAASERQILTVYSNEYTYDGEEHSIVAKATVEGTTFQYSTDGTTWDDTKPTLTNVGSMTVYVRATKSGQPTLEGQGTVTITKRNVYIISGSDNKIYDGTPLALDDTYAYGYVDGDTITAKATGTITKPGTCANTIEYQFADASKAKNYNVILREGTLTVSKIDITITSASGVKSYDGNAYSRNKVVISNGSFLQGDLKEGYPKATGTITEVGETANTIDYGWVSPEKAEYYNITEKLGTLYVADSPVVFKGYTTSKEYDGVAVKPTRGLVGINGEYSVEFSTDGGLSYSKTAPEFKDAGTYEVPMRLTYGGQYYYTTSTVIILKRKLTVVSSSDTKEYDGTPLASSACDCVEGFAVGDSAKVKGIGSQTEVGNSKNYVSLEWAQGVNSDNYDITYVLGTLTVLKKAGTKFMTEDAEIEFTSLDVYSLYNGSNLRIPYYITTRDANLLSAYTNGEWNNLGNITKKLQVQHNPSSATESFVTQKLKTNSPDYETVYATVTVHQVPITLNVNLSVPNSKTYDGNVNATATINSVSGILEADKSSVEVTVNKAEYKDANAGTGKKVIVSYKTTGAKAAFYKVSGDAVTGRVINPADLSSVTVEAIPVQGFTGSAIQPKLNVTYNDMTLVENVDYTVGYANNINVGTATVTLTGIGNYTGTKSVTFNIVETAFDVTFDMQDHGTQVDAQRVKAGELAAEPSKPSADGYLFGGWYTEKSLNTKWDFSTPITKNTTLYAQWVKLEAKTNVGKTNAKVDTKALSELLSKYTGCASKVAAEIIVSQDQIRASDKTMIEAANPNKSYEYYDVKLMFTEENDTLEYGDKNKTLIPITYQFDFEGKSDVQVFRVHNSTLGELKETPNADGEYVEFDKTNGEITVYAKKYSTYGFVYSSVNVPGTGDKSNVGLYLVLLAVSCCAFVVVLLKRKAIKK